MKVKFTNKLSWIFLIMISLGIKITAQTIPSYVPTNGLVGWWPFNGNANDESGNGNHGTVNGATLTSDRFQKINSGYNFDGVNDDIFFGYLDDLGNQNSISISLWFTIDYYGTAAETFDFSTIFMKVKDDLWNSKSGWKILLNKDINFRERRGIYLYFDDSPPYFFKYNFDLKKWYQMVVTVSSKIATVHINGALVNSLHISNNLITNKYGSFIGKGNTKLPVTHGYLLPGNMDDIAIWNRALTEQEIKGLYNAASSNFTIAASSGSNGTISPSGSVEVVSQTSKRFVFTPSTGYQVDSVLVNNRLVDSIQGFTFLNVSSNQTIRVTFKKLPSFDCEAKNTFINNPQNYIIGPNSNGGQCKTGIHLSSKWINTNGIDSISIKTFQHRLFDFSKIYNKNNILIWSWLGENDSNITWYPKNHTLFIGGNDSLRIEFYQGYQVPFCNGFLAITNMKCTTGTSAANPCQAKDSAELVRFKGNIQNLTWNTKDPMNSWQGVKVNASGCVTHLILNELGLSGTLIDLSLDSLVELELMGNKLSGSIPSFSNLKKLKALWLSNNQLSGSIPNFQLPEIQSIDLANNSLSGNIPAFNLSNLMELGLANNKLTGTIPTLNTPKLAWLRLNNNALTGNIPNWNFQDLQGIYLQANNLSGTLPDLKLNDLRHFNVDSNALQGNLKHNFPNLWELNLANNKFTNLTDLVSPSLGQAIFHRNQVSGKLNTGFSQYVNLEKLQFEYNKWTFEALVPISSYLNDKKGSYSPQELIYPDTIIKSNAGKSLEIDLVIDASVKDNIYTWLKEGKPFKTLTGNNKLLFPTLQLADTGNYQVFITHPNLKNLTLSSRNIKIQIPCSPTQSVRNDTICAGTSLNFAGQTISKEGPYIGRFSSVQGCDSTVTLNLVVRPAINAVPMSFIEACKIYATVDVSGGVSPIQYLWSNGGKAAEITDLKPETNYTLTLTDTKGCKKDISLKTPALKPLDIIPSYKTANCEKENGEIKLTITGTAPFMIDWGKNTMGSGDTLRKGLVSGSYTVYVKDANDCKDTLPMYLEKPTDCKPSYKVYSSFSPNGDGVNDIFTIDPLYCTSEDLATCFPNNELIIFNRWSDVVFKASPYNNTWEAKGLPEGTYYYLFTAGPEIKKTEKGYITLIKRQ
jgi:gliding motility-associated-like protein